MHGELFDAVSGFLTADGKLLFDGLLQYAGPHSREPPGIKLKPKTGGELEEDTGMTFGCCEGGSFKLINSHYTRCSFPHKSQGGKLPATVETVPGRDIRQEFPIS